MAPLGSPVMLLAVIVSALWVSAASAEEYAATSPACLKRSTLGSGRVNYQNECGTQVIIHYCNPARPLTGVICGQQKSKYNVYYTHRRYLSPGSSVEWHPEVRVAPCLSVKSPRPFRSNSAGGFACPVDTSGHVTAAALAPTESEACHKARALLTGASRANAPCDCTAKQRRTGERVHYCKATGLVDPKELPPVNVVRDVQRWLREALACDSKESSCDSKRNRAVIGVRG